MILLYLVDFNFIPEVRRHQERIREHEAKLRDHEVTSEAFAKIIATPAQQQRDRKVSFQASIGSRLIEKDLIEHNG